MAQLAGHTILVVEDESLIALDMMAILHAEGAQVIAARSVLEAFEVAAFTRISAAILDVNLGPEGDCAPICRMLDQRHVPFLFYTGYPEGGVLEEFPRASVLPKPATKKQLLDCILGALGQEHSNRRHR
jgi:CheY-like chemotaxis protein